MFVVTRNYDEVKIIKRLLNYYEKDPRSTMKLLRNDDEAYSIWMMEFWLDDTQWIEKPRTDSIVTNLTSKQVQSRQTLHPFSSDKHQNRFVL